MKSNLIFLLLVIFITSCTIQKRVHNRGWHVQWKSNRSVSNQDSKENKSIIAVTEIGEIQPDCISLEREFEEAEYSQASAERSSQEVVDLHNQSDQVTVVEPSVDVRSTESVIHKEKNAHAKLNASYRKIRNLGGPTMLFVLAGIFLLLALSCGLAIAGATDIIAFSLMFFGAAAFGVIALILLLMALVILLAGTSGRKRR